MLVKHTGYNPYKIDYAGLLFLKSFSNTRSIKTEYCFKLRHSKVVDQLLTDFPYSIFNIWKTIKGKEGGRGKWPI